MNCPSCHNEVKVLERNYGALFTCPKCQAIYFVNFEGQAEFSNEPMTTGVENPVESPVINPDENLTNYIADNLAVEFNESTPEFEVSAFQGIAQEISDFGNSEVQITALNYTLQINGLDSKEDIKIFQEIVTDSRFGWDVTELLKQIKNGQIILDKLNPVQAFVLHKRIHFLNFELKWKQNVLE